MKTYNFFNFQDIISTLRKSDVKNTELLMPFEAYYSPISEDRTLEEMPFYQEYLAAFDIEGELAGFTLREDFFPPSVHKALEKIGGIKCLDPKPSADDLELMQRLIFGSLSVGYELVQDKDIPSVYRLVIHAEGRQKSATRGLEQVTMDQFKKMFRIFIVEQIRLSVILTDENDPERDDVWRERANRLALFLEKAQMLREGKSRDEKRFG